MEVREEGMEVQEEAASVKIDLVSPLIKAF